MERVGGWGSGTNNSINPVSISPENEHDTSQMMRLLLLDTSSTSEMTRFFLLSPKIVVYDDQYYAPSCTLHRY